MLIFSLTVNECLLYSRSNLTGYYQTTERVQRNNLIIDSSLYFFSKDYSKKSIQLFLTIISIKFQHYLKEQIRIILKLQIVARSKFHDLTSKILINHILNNSEKQHKNLYIG